MRTTINMKLLLYPIASQYNKIKQYNTNHKANLCEQGVRLENRYA